MTAPPSYDELRSLNSGRCRPPLPRCSPATAAAAAAWRAARPTRPSVRLSPFVGVADAAVLAAAAAATYAARPVGVLAPLGSGWHAASQRSLAVCMLGVAAALAVLSLVLLGVLGAPFCTRRRLGAAAARRGTSLGTSLLLHSVGFGVLARALWSCVTIGPFTYTTSAQQSRTPALAAAAASLLSSSAASPSSAPPTPAQPTAPKKRL